MDQKEEIFILFHRVIGKSQGLRLMNTYKSLPISYPATLIDIQQDCIVVESEPMQIVCMSRDRYALIASELTFTLVKAKVEEVNFANNRVVLRDFHFLTGGIGNRVQVRVEPRSSVFAFLSIVDSLSMFLVQIADISLDGLAFYVNTSQFSPDLMRAGVTIDAHFHLPLEETPSMRSTTASLPETHPLQKDYDLYRYTYEAPPLFQPSFVPSSTLNPRETHLTDCIIHGIVVNTLPDLAHDSYRVGLRTLNDYSTRSVVSKYVVQRQAEIIAEVRSLYTLISRLVKNEITSARV